MWTLDEDNFSFVSREMRNNVDGTGKGCGDGNLAGDVDNLHLWRLDWDCDERMCGYMYTNPNAFPHKSGDGNGDGA